MSGTTREWLEVFAVDEDGAVLAWNGVPLLRCGHRHANVFEADSCVMPHAAKRSTLKRVRETVSDFGAVIR